MTSNITRVKQMCLIVQQSPATTTSPSCESRHSTLSISPILVAACKLGMLFLKIAISNPRISTCGRRQHNI